MSGTIDTWTDNSGDWFTAGDWSTGVPTANSAVVLQSTSATPITITYDPVADHMATTDTIFSLSSDSNSLLNLASGTLIVANGNNLAANGGLTDSGTFELATGTLTLGGTLTNSGMVAIGGGSTEASLAMGQIAATSAGTIDINLHGTAKLLDPTPSSQSVVFTTNTGELAIGSPLQDSAPVFGFRPGNDIHFYTVAYNGSDTVGYNAGSGLLTISQGGTTVASVTLEGSYTASEFRLQSDDHGQMELIIPCFAAGTRIATPDGETAVEDLRMGERVLTATGETRPIVWIGSRRIDCRAHPEPDTVLPVRARAGAFGAGLPRRDLLLSPDHAVFAEGVLIPIRYLLNGATVTQQDTAEVRYFHIELASHDVLLAESLPVESYLDTGNRAAFANGGAHLMLHADFTPLSWNDACAPLCLSGPPVQAMRRKLRGRAEQLGWRVTEASDVRVLADGRVVRAAAVKGKLHHFLLPAETREVRIVSRTGVPAGLDLAFSDCRRLGARIGAVFLDEELVTLDSPVLAEGFYPIEQNGAELWRWTDGAARLILPDGSERSGPILLELLVRNTMPSWHRTGSAEVVAEAA